MTPLLCQYWVSDQVGTEQLLSPLFLRFVSQHTVVAEETSSDGMG